jgi:ribonuclease P protein subunit POP4
VILKDLDVLRGEFIGKYIKAEGSNVQGKIIDETKNSFLIKTNNGRKRILKQNTAFQVKSDNKLISVDGKSILMKPEDRIKIQKWE